MILPNQALSYIHFYFLLIAKHVNLMESLELNSVESNAANMAKNKLLNDRNKEKLKIQHYQCAISHFKGVKSFTFLLQKMSFHSEKNKRM